MADGRKTLVETAHRVLPAGNFGNFASDIIIHRGQGAHVWDVDGNEYVDFLLGSGPMFVGHSHPEVVEAVLRQVPLGTTFFANNEHGIRLAAEIVEALPCAEQVRFMSSGTEADLYAMRVARAFRGRDKILKFEGGYHGMSDWSLMSLAPKKPGNFPRGVPDSAGIPKSVQDEVIVAPFNDLEAAVALIRAHQDELGGVIVEPFQRLIPPKPGFLEGLRAITAELGIPLIFDEVVTGFRFAYGGAQSYYGVTPDLCTLGKIIGGGFPLSAVAGRADIMAHFDRAKVGDDGFLVNIGTLSGNPVASVAGLATMAILKRPGAYEKAFATGQTLMDGFAAAIREAGLPAQVIGVPPLFDIVWAEGDIKDYRSTLAADTALQKRVNVRLREAGILKGDSKFYISLAHDEADVAHTLEAFSNAVKAEAKA
ncbi:glutamate-1-semialdehyde 2,1-aminomutase [Stella humosa]|uniref:Glutamate-1-semialdehyde 2,1-aminomutase n=1 Tax=Stella humosa TaxID=94 RepID=A0A3N1KTZ6_9PROT|nr:aminotransferase class III-fold pyridoxal phosphate-dependent enzyme [Stella humosa]ROP83454.1 glutamate-1-semialdehyde 2,1-aminomutase [Stella humosa]BBK33274.1 aspartate aminotransferase family protein [Stella humosa]